MKASLSTFILAGLLVVSGLGVLIACGNLVTLPLIQAQLIEAVPGVEQALEEAVRVSRKKTYYGLGICVPILLCSSGLLLAQYRRSRASL